MKITEGRPHPLGSRYDGGGTNFSVFSSIAEKIEVCFFDDDGSERRFELTGKTGSIRHGYFESIAPGQRYGFRVHGPWNPAEGHLCSPQKLLLDPYTMAVDGSVTWDDSLFPLDPDQPSTPVNDGDTAAFVPKSVVVDPLFDWRNGGPLRTRLEDTVIYEVHVKGFTARHPDIPPELRGTYAGLAHPASISHFTRLGVTAVELLPVQQFVHRRRLVDQGLRNYWGYDPICLFAPHNEYAGDRSPGGVVNEFKEMIRAFHAVGIEVIMDVVFNHTAEGDAAGPILGFKGIDNSTYYRLNPADRSRYVDYTGTHNTLKTDHPQVRQMILDSLRHWATDMQIDGFRFDLAPVLVRGRDAVDFGNAFFESVRRDPVLNRVKLIAEPWDVGKGGYRLGRFPAEWSEWNDKYRDDVRDFWRGRRGATGPFAMRFAGSPDFFGPERPPQAGVNMVACHDGFTLHDLVSYEKKHNRANGEANNDGHNDNRSWNCGVEGPTKDTDVNALRSRQKRNLLATLLLSHGVPMLLGGDELGRTQKGNNNAYCQDNEISWYDWDDADNELLEFASFLTHLRRQRDATRQKVWPQSNGPDDRKPLTHLWYDADGRPIRPADMGDSDPQPIQTLVAARFEEETNGDEKESLDEILVMFNPTDAEATFTIPEPNEAGPWYIVVDTAVPTQPTPVRTAKTGERVQLIPHSLTAWVRRV